MGPKNTYWRKLQLNRSRFYRQTPSSAHFDDLFRQLFRPSLVHPHFHIIRLRIYLRMPVPFLAPCIHPPVAGDQFSVDLFLSIGLVKLAMAAVPAEVLCALVG